MTDQHVIETTAGVEPDSPLAEALRARAEIMGLSQASHDAVIRPREPGGLSPGERAALAARVARTNGDEALAAHYRSLLLETGDEPAFRSIAEGGPAPDADPRLGAIVRHVDLLTIEPRKATCSDIEALKAAGVGEPDIVRLSELAAFLSYQVRVIAGLKLLKGLR